jgi:DnaK suppressor protein
MDQSQLDDFKSELLDAKNAIINRVKQAESDGRETDSDREAQDLADKAANSYTKELLFSKSSSDRQFLQMIEEALERIKDGTFGECENCEEPIGTRRIKAVPWARLCIRCQELVEQGKL